MKRTSHRKSTFNGMRLRDTTEILVSSVAGIAFGAAVMYLFDPDVGRRRRDQIRDRAGAAVEEAAGRLSSGISSAADGIRGSAQSALERARQTAGEYAQDLSERAAQCADRGHSRAGSGAKIGAALFGPLALGCCAMYFFDPRNGRDRRARVMDTASDLLDRFVQAAQSTGRRWFQRSDRGYPETDGTPDMETSTRPSSQGRIPTAM